MIKENISQKTREEKICEHNNFVLISRKMLDDERISPTAKGILGFIYSHPESWTFTAEKLSSQLHFSKVSIKKAIKELLNTNYCTVLHKTMYEINL